MLLAVACGARQESLSPPRPISTPTHDTEETEPEETEPEPQREERWTGTYTGVVVYDCGRQITGTFDGVFTITVDAEQVATMNITHTVTGSCLGPTEPTETSPVTVTGERTPTGFEFPSYLGGSAPFTITVEGDQGTGTLIEGSRPGIVRIEVEYETERE
jgi:hypothetical protein